MACTIAPLSMCMRRQIFLPHALATGDSVDECRVTGAPAQLSTVDGQEPGPHQQVALVAQVGAEALVVEAPVEGGAAVVGTVGAVGAGVAVKVAVMGVVREVGKVAAVGTRPVQPRLLPSAWPGRPGPPAHAAACVEHGVQQAAGPARQAEGARAVAALGAAWAVAAWVGGLEDQPRLRVCMHRDIGCLLCLESLSEHVADSNGVCGHG